MVKKISQKILQEKESAAFSVTRSRDGLTIVSLKIREKWKVPDLKGDGTTNRDVIVHYESEADVLKKGDK